jgi:NADH-quinone oxidoreductase subunit C
LSSVEPEAPAAPPETSPAPPPAPADDRNQAVVDALATELGDALIETHTQRGELWVRVHRDAWKRTAEVLRHQLGFDYFCFLSGIDWMPHTWPNPKVVEGDGADAVEGDGGDEESDNESATVGAEPEPAPAGDGGTGSYQTGYAGGDSRFQVLARVYSTARHAGLTLKADLDDAAPTVDTWSQVYAGADWHERETWEMYGFQFTGHPHLVHIYLPGEFEGFPLRKDFPLLSREVKPWPGLVDVEGFPAGYEEPGSSEGDGDAS